MTKDEALTLALEILKAAYVPTDLDEQREKAITELEALAQPERTWVGLTDEDKDAIIRVTESDHYHDILMLAEAKLKEKNA